MQFDYTHTYAAEPARVVALLRNEDFIADVAEHAGALEHSSEIADESTTITMKLKMPERLSKFLGQTLQMKQVFVFEAAQPDGSIVGKVDVAVPGMPVEVKADATMTPQGEETLAHYTGDLKVRIPLVGKKAEEQVEPFIRAAFDGLGRRAAHWLAK